MKKQLPIKTQKQRKNRGIKACRVCEYCKLDGLDEAAREPRSDTAQLYAREAESYFFYYALAVNKNQ